MKPTNYIQHTDSTVLSFPDRVQQSTVVKREGPSYGKICDGAGNFRLSYEGEKPIRNFAIASAISVVSFILKTAAVTAVPIFVTWRLKKMGIIKDNNDMSLKDHNPALPPLPHLPLGPRVGTLKGDVIQAAEDGEPENILSSEIHKDSRLIIFSGPGVGKSILVNQLSIGIGSGKPCGVFPDEVESTPQNVLLIDTEQEDTDLNIRYADGVD